jgi:hypothetical protein
MQRMLIGLFVEMRDDHYGAAHGLGYLGEFRQELAHLVLPMHFACATHHEIPSAIELTD